MIAPRVAWRLGLEWLKTAEKMLRWCGVTIPEGDAWCGLQQSHHWWKSALPAFHKLHSLRVCESDSWATSPVAIYGLHHFYPLSMVGSHSAPHEAWQVTFPLPWPEHWQLQLASADRFLKQQPFLLGIEACHWWLIGHASDIGGLFCPHSDQPTSKSSCITQMGSGLLQCRVCVVLLWWQAVMLPWVMQRAIEWLLGHLEDGSLGLLIALLMVVTLSHWGRKLWREFPIC